MVQDLLEELPSAHRLALAYAPAASQQHLLAVFALDARLAKIVRKRNEAVLAQIRIAWWRETLRKKPEDWPKGDLVLTALRQWSDVAPVSGLTDGWEFLLDEILSPDAIRSFADGRASAMAGAARELGVVDTEAVDTAARYWALGDLSANLTDPEERQQILAIAQSLPPVPSLPRAFRPLAILARLGARSLQAGGGPLLDGPGSMVCALRVGLFGR